MFNHFPWNSSQEESAGRVSTLNSLSAAKPPPSWSADIPVRLGCASPDESGQECPRSSQKKFIADCEQFVRLQYSGFSLLELMGVLAILTVVALALAPMFVTKVRLATAAKEEVTLKALAEGLKRHIQKQKNIPDQTTWIPAIAQAVGWEVDKVGANDSKFPRIYLIDPAFRIGASNGVLPYTQQNTGSVIRPISPRLMILSSLSTQPLPLTSGTNDAFNNIWTNASDTVPSSLSISNWVGRADELKVQRINLASLFQRVLIVNYDSAGNYATNTFGDLPNPVPTQTNWDAYFITGTSIGLFGTNNLEAKEILQRDTAYAWERNKWRGTLFDGYGNSSIELLSRLFMDSADRFMGINNCPAATTLMINIQTFFNAYSLWAANCYATWGTNEWPSAAYSGPYYDIVDSAQRALDPKHLALGNCQGDASSSVVLNGNALYDISGTNDWYNLTNVVQTISGSVWCGSPDKVVNIIEVKLISETSTNTVLTDDTKKGVFSFPNQAPGKYMVAVRLPQTITKGSTQGTYTNSATLNPVSIIVFPMVDSSVSIGVLKQ